MFLDILRLLQKSISLFRNALVFVKVAKPKKEELSNEERIIDDHLIDEIKAIHGSDFDLYLNSLKLMNKL